MKAPPRLPDWETRLNALVSERRKEPFRWGSHDCALWGADVVSAQTGKDFGASFRGKYDDAEGAAKALREFGAGTILRTFDRHLKRIHPAQARRGDLVRARPNAAARNRTHIISAPSSIGVVIGSDALFVDDDGLVRLPRSEWATAWRV